MTALLAADGSDGSGCSNLHRLNCNALMKSHKERQKGNVIFTRSHSVPERRSCSRLYGRSYLFEHVLYETIHQRDIISYEVDADGAGVHDCIGSRCDSYTPRCSKRWHLLDLVARNGRSGPSQLSTIHCRVGAFADIRFWWACCHTHAEPLKEYINQRIDFRTMLLVSKLEEL